MKMTDDHPPPPFRLSSVKIEHETPADTYSIQCELAHDGRVSEKVETNVNSWKVGAVRGWSREQFFESDKESGRYKTGASKPMRVQNAQ